MEQEPEDFSKQTFVINPARNELRIEITINPSGIRLEPSLDGRLGFCGFCFFSRIVLIVCEGVL